MFVMKPDKKEEKYILKLGKRVTKLREESGLSIQELAERANLTRMSIYQVESGMRVSSILVLRRVAKAMGIKLSELVKE